MRGALWWAHLAHRLSGLALALFLPAHFWVLAMAVTDPGGLDSFLAFADAPLVKLAETGLVFLLALHIAGGLRLLAFEFLPWSSGQKSAAAVAVAASFAVSVLFLSQAI